MIFILNYATQVELEACKLHALMHLFVLVCDNFMNETRLIRRPHC